MQMAAGAEAIGSLYLNMTLSELVTKMCCKRCILAFQPGTRWQYGLSTDVLGRVLEIAFNQTLEELFHTYIFKPLGMLDTHFYITEQEHEQRLTPLFVLNSNANSASNNTTYMKLSDNTVRDNRCKSLCKSGKVMYSAGGGLVSTISDYYKFAQALLNAARGGKDENGMACHLVLPHLTAAAAQEMMRDQLPRSLNGQPAAFSELNWSPGKI